MKPRTLTRSGYLDGPSNAFDRWCLRLGRLTVLMTLLVVPIVLAEAVARWLHQPVPIRRVYDPYAYRIPQPLLVDQFDTLDGEPMTVRLNELGMRGPSIEEPQPDDGLTVVFLGGSTTENYAFPHQQTFPVLVGQHVAAELGRPVRVFNAGMSAATTGTSLARLQHQVLDLEPSLIVLMHGINDLVFGFHPAFRTDGRHLIRPPTAGHQPRSFLWDWVRQRRERTRAANPLPKGAERRFEAYESFPALRVFERNLQSMAAIARGHRIPIVFLTQATLYRADPQPDDPERFRLASAVAAHGGIPPDIPSLALGMAAFNAVVLDLETDSWVQTHDLAASLPRTRELIYDECHFTRVGNSKVAVELAPVLSSILSSASPG